MAAGLRVEDLRGADWSRFAALVLAPGVPLTHPEPHWTVAKARAAGVEIVGDIELFCRERAKSCTDAPFVAITGTNGKSTTTALIAHILRAAGKDAQMGGNIGTAILDLEPPAEGRIHVIEMSSFQIELTPSLAPSVGVLLNISPDHLDRHGTMEHYAGLKARLVAHAAHPVVGEDDDWCRDIAERLRLANRGWVDLVSARSRVAHGWYAVGSELVARAPWTGPLGAFADLAGIGSLRGAAQHPERAGRQRCGNEPRRAARRSGGRAVRRSPACRIAWRRSGGSAARSSSTTARPPTPTAPPLRSPRSSATSTGSWAASRKRAASPARAVFPAHRQGVL